MIVVTINDCTIDLRDGMSDCSLIFLILGAPYNPEKEEPAR